MAFINYAMKQTVKHLAEIIRSDQIIIDVVHHTYLDMPAALDVYVCTVYTVLKPNR